MKRKNKIGRIALAGLAALASGCAFTAKSTDSVDDVINLRIAQDADYFGTREKVREPIKIGGKPVMVAGKEVYHTVTNESQTAAYTTTLGIGFGEDNSWNSENIRVYNRVENDGMITTNWMEFAGRGTFRTGAVENKLLVFGASGDRQGLGFQTKHSAYSGERKIGTLTLNGDFEKIDEDTDSTRLGAEVEVNLTGKTSVGFAYDCVSVRGIKTDYALARLAFQPDKENKIRFVYERADSDVEGITHSGILSYTHIEDSWGGRFRAEVSRNNQSERTDSLVELVLLENPNSGHGWGDAVVSRDNGDVRARNVLPNALDLEVPPNSARSNGGWLGSLRLDYSTQEGTTSGRTKFELGHSWSIGEGEYFSVVPFGKYTFANGENGHGYGTDFVYNKDDLFWMISLERNEFGNVEDFGAYVYLGKNLSFGK